MDHDNVAMLRDGYDAFSKGDMARLAELFTDDAAWHVPGRGPLAGDYSGKDAIFAMFGRLFELTQGTVRVDVTGLFADDQQGVGISNNTATRGDANLSVAQVVIFRITEGLVAEAWESTTDQYAVDEFFA